MFPDIFIIGMHIFINRLSAFTIGYKSSKKVFHRLPSNKSRVKMKVFRRIPSKSRVLNYMILNTQPSSNCWVPGTSLHVGTLYYDIFMSLLT